MPPASSMGLVTAARPSRAAVAHMLVMIAVADGIADPGDAADLNLVFAVAPAPPVDAPVLGRPRPGFRRPVGVVDHDRLLLRQILDPGTTFRV